VALYHVRRTVSPASNGAADDWDHDSGDRRYAVGDTFEDRGTTWRVVAVEPPRPRVHEPVVHWGEHLLRRIWSEAGVVAHSMSHRLSVAGFGGQLHVERPHVYEAVLTVEPADAAQQSSP
jgi:hypothetical protein